jgi:hypothetical protein
VFVSTAIRGLESKLDALDSDQTSAWKSNQERNPFIGAYVPCGQVSGYTFVWKGTGSPTVVHKFATGTTAVTESACAYPAGATGPQVCKGSNPLDN